jgi:hypothetical protein
MSTTRYINKVYAADETGVGEDSATQSSRQVIEVFRAGENITIGDAVCCEVSQTTIAQMFGVVKKLNSGAANTSVFCGIASQTATSGDFVKVIVEGLAVDANVDGATAKGDYLILSSTGGRLEPQATVELVVNGAGALAVTGLSPVSQTVDVGGNVGAVKCAIALEADTANKADVWVLKSY